MADVRNRISITLTDLEKDEIDQIASVLGVKSTRCVYEALKAGLPILVKQAQVSQSNIGFLKRASENMFSR